MIVEPHEKFEGVFWVKEEGVEDRLATKNLAPGFKVYGEPLIQYKGVEYRVWNPFRSKLAGAILKKVAIVPLRKGDRVLYLGAATGTTASHVSDIVGERGRVFCVEFSSRVMRELVRVCEARKNMLPILADARLPVTYRAIVEQVDAIYCDVAQPEQAKLLADNADMFLKHGGWIMLAIKARSVDVTKEPSDVYKKEMNTLKSRGFKLESVVHLEPFDKDHAMVVARYEP
ncbi:MAG: fibrillarin-like rRNA/tRNA 2'-O-methyltransferase [Candidatus Methanomethylicota archaeon]|uniref:Fibrillarin-like rRNA/tRNA 2'-O-methyltransferase n=1 Tax=Thermoproteota archaeon TaxID=2056631 RepID=A0A497ENG5_9CREN|nr:MAG: fibrillarin-like rRNA/tRNA 2'-O-methyltransferase [Candidatus Verstraetearchaeota archaeon]RLE52877.1 MAG: fibrillarin-like rRNA/tRNA 2'-O-methyltransferase [Candidatus Verstraetearchaeota archaeon]